MEDKWMLRVVFILAVFFCRTLATGNSHSTNGMANSPASEKTMLEVFRSQKAAVGSMITLQCTEKNVDLSKMLYAIWNISSKEKNCRIGMAENDPDFNTCNDGKSLHLKGRNLTIPNFSIKDEGNYSCDLSYQGGGTLETIHLSAFFPPKMSKHLEAEGGHTFAVCEVQSIPEASIEWRKPWPFASPTNSSSQHASGLVTLTSRLQLPQNASLKNLTCVVQCSNQEEIQLTFESEVLPDHKSVKWPFIFLGVCATCFIVIFLTGLCIMREKLTQLRVFRKICCTSQISQAPREEKTPQPRDTEEVEPYASYVQRVNSIYNSSAELFNA